jgi:hypothetical protein
LLVEIESFGGVVLQTVPVALLEPLLGPTGDLRELLSVSGEATEDQRGTVAGDQVSRDGYRSLWPVPSVKNMAARAGQEAIDRHRPAGRLQRLPDGRISNGSA